MCHLPSTLSSRLDGGDAFMFLTWARSTIKDVEYAVEVSVPAHMVSVLHCMGPSNLAGNEKLQIEAGLQQ